MTDVIKLLQDEYGFQIIDQREAGGRTILETDKGLYNLYLYPQGYRTKKPLIDQVKKHIAKQARFTMLPVEKTKDKHSYLTVGDKILYVQRGVREGEMENQAFATGQALAEFHQCSASFTGDTIYYPFRSNGSWPSMWRKKISNFEAIRENLEKETREFTPFDEYLLTTYTYVHHIADTAEQYLQANGYQKAVKLTAGYGKIAFQNFDDGFLLFHEDGTKRLAGEYSWVLDMRARDIGQWIKAEIRRKGYQPEAVAQFLAGYNQVSRLLEEEYAVIYSLLMYPGRFFRQVELYDRMEDLSAEELDWESWAKELDQELIAMEEVLCQFPLLAEEEYGVQLPQVEWVSRAREAAIFE